MTEIRAIVRDIWNAFKAITRSRKGLMAIFLVLASFGIDVDPNVQAGIVTLAGIVYMGGTAWEDAAEKRNGL
jgi:hypothetical protein